MNRSFASHFTSWLSAMVATGLLMPSAVSQQPQPRASFAVTVEEFASLSEHDQLSLLAESVIEWKAKIANFSAGLLVDVENRDINSENNRPTDRVLQATERREWRIRRVGNSYRISLESVGRDNPDHENAGSKKESTAYDAAKRERRSFSDRAGDLPDTAVVGTQHSRMLMDCPLMALIGARSELAPGVSRFDVTSRFLDNRENASVHEIDRAARTAEVRFPVKWFGKDGACSQTFRLQQLGLPVTEEIIVYESPEKEKYRYNTTLGEFASHDGVWFPGQLVMEIWYSGAPESVTVHQLDIVDVSLNALSPHDLKLEFPPDTLVAAHGKNDSTSPTGYHVVTKNGDLGPQYVDIHVAMAYRDHQLGSYDDAALRSRLKALEAAIDGRPEKGMKAPAIAARRTRTNTVEEVRFEDKFTAIEFWSTSCGPCQSSMSTFNEFASVVSGKYPGKVQCVAICLGGDVSTVQQHIESRNWVNLKSFVDRNAVETNGSTSSFPYKVARDYAVAMIPLCIIIDDKGEIVYRGRSIDEGKSALLDRLEPN